MERVISDTRYCQRTSTTHKIAVDRVLRTSERAYSKEGSSLKRRASCSPALIYLTWPATHTTRLPSGRPSTSCLRLRSYSEAGIPGVTSACLTAHAHTHPLSASDRGWWANAAGRAHRGGGGISRWVDQRRRAWAADGAGALDREWWRTREVRVVNLEGKNEQSYATRESQVET